MFGITCSAVSHIVEHVKGRMKTDQDFQRDYGLLNSQIKMTLISYYHLLLDQAKHLTLRGGWTSDFLDRDSFTILNSITISGGTIVPDKIVLK